MSMITAVLALLLNLNIGYSRHVEDERDNLKKIIEESKIQYESEKKNIELLNIKCHDLKHQFASMKGKIYEEQIDELSEIIDIYDGSVKTGNEALDVIITQKSLYCNQHGIRFTCLLNGENFNFISPHELYALFCNAIDNAIEAVEKVEEEKRIIKIIEQKTGGFLSVRIQNYYSGELNFKDGIPVSTKKEEGHGYGVKSMQMIAEKYGGGISASTNGELFILDIFVQK